MGPLGELTMPTAQIRLTDRGFRAELEDGRVIEHAELEELAAALFAAGVTSDEAHCGDWREGDHVPLAGQAIGLKVALKRAARAEQRRVDLGRLARHAEVAAALRDPQQRAELLAIAWNSVDRWERERLCSPCYIEAWRELLAGDLDALCALLVEDSGHATALRQNTPFIVSMIRPRSDV